MAQSDRRCYSNNKLYSWRIPQCSCGRFLAKHQQKHCTKCASKLRKEILKRKDEKYAQQNPEKIRLKNFRYWIRNKTKILERKRQQYAKKVKRR